MRCERSDPAKLPTEPWSTNVQRRTFPAFQAERAEPAEPGRDGADDALILSRWNRDRRGRAVLPPARRRKRGVHHIGLHGPHASPINPFFWDGTNRREDEYGGKDLPGRARFAADIVRAVRKAVGAELPILLRISQWKQQDYAVKLADTPRALEAWFKP